jgi:hypothetical protein
MSYELTLTISRVSEEHAAYVAQQLEVLGRLFKLDGSDVETLLSAERDRDGQEAIYGLLPDQPEKDAHALDTLCNILSTGDKPWPGGADFLDMTAEIVRSTGRRIK